MQRSGASANDSQPPHLTACIHQLKDTRLAPHSQRQVSCQVMHRMINVLTSPPCAPAAVAALADAAVGLKQHTRGRVSCCCLCVGPAVLCQSSSAPSTIKL
jgi:hypothetical protein